MATSDTRNLHIFLLVTDRGSNEVLAKKLWATLARDTPQVIIFPMDCLEHQSHLITLQSLKLADDLLKRHGADFKYFASLATVSNTLRDVARNFFESWCDIHGDVLGVKVAKKLWPKLIGGRWNSCDEVEKRMLQCGGKTMMGPVLKSVFSKKKDFPNDAPPKQSDSSKANTGGADVVDELNYQESQAYSRKMGLWRRNTEKYVQQSLWWVVAEAMSIARGPNVHMSVS